MTTIYVVIEGTSDGPEEREYFHDAEKANTRAREMQAVQDSYYTDTGRPVPGYASTFYVQSRTVK